MSKRQLIVIELGIIVAIVAILFPPYGFNRYVETVYTADRMGIYQINTNDCPWQNVGYALIFSHPPKSPFLSDSERNYDTDMRIGGHILAAELAVIALSTAGMFLWFQKRP
jgi:hypothetical protein